MKPTKSFKLPHGYKVLYHKPANGVASGSIILVDLANATEHRQHYSAGDRTARYATWAYDHSDDGRYYGEYCQTFTEAMASYNNR